MNLRIPALVFLVSLVSGAHAQAEQPAAAAAAAAASASAPSSPAGSSSESESPDCVPPCRIGFVCVAKECVSACNPPCGRGETCTGAGECEAIAESSGSSGVDGFEAEPSERPKPVPWERNSTGRMVGGIVVTSVGGLLVFVGGMMLLAGDVTTCRSGGDCEGTDFRGTGTALALVGGAGVAVGIPLIVSGARRVPRRNRSHSDAQAATLRYDDVAITSAELVLGWDSVALRSNW